MRGRAAIVLSVVMGLLAVVLMSIYISGRERSLLQMSAMKDVLVANLDILRGTAVDERMLVRIQVPAKYVQPGAIADPREVIGRVVAVPVPRGSQLIGTYLEDAGRSALAYEVPRGRRAVTLAVNDITGVGGLIRPGNFVDILGTFEFGRPISQSGGRVQYAEERTEARMLMQNVLVIAVGQDHQATSPAAPANAQANQDGTSAAAQVERQSRPTNITCLVDPQQAQQLVLAQQIGTLTMALRSNLDAGQVVDFGTLDPLGLLNVQIPIKPRSTPAWREIRGGGGPF
jgi:pilus assembly protein CpaB